MLGNKSVLLVCIMAFGGLSACRTTSKEAAPTPSPKLVKGGVGGPRLSLSANANGFSLAGKKQVIELDLTVSQPKLPADAGMASLPHCALPLEPEEQVGEVSCASGKNKTRVPLLAKHIRQVCSAGANPMTPVGPSAKHTGIKKCPSLMIQMNQYSPAIIVRLSE